MAHLEKARLINSLLIIPISFGEPLNMEQFSYALLKRNGKTVSTLPYGKYLYTLHPNLASG